jgi:hypothetical protein
MPIDKTMYFIRLQEELKPWNQNKAVSTAQENSQQR